MKQIVVRLLVLFTFLFGFAHPAQAATDPSAIVEWSMNTMTITLYTEGHPLSDFDGGIMHYRSDGVSHTLQNMWTDNGDGTFSWVQYLTPNVDRIWIENSPIIEWISWDWAWRPGSFNGIERLANIVSEWEPGTKTLTLVIYSSGYTFPSSFQNGMAKLSFNDGTSKMVTADWQPVQQGENPYWAWNIVTDDTLTSVTIDATVPLQWYGSHMWEARTNGLYRPSYPACSTGPLAPGTRCWLLSFQHVIGDVQVRDETFQWLPLYDSDGATGVVFNSPGGPALIEAPWGAYVNEGLPFPSIVQMLTTGCGPNPGCANVSEWTYPNLDQPVKIWTKSDIHQVFVPFVTR